MKIIIALLSHFVITFTYSFGQCDKKNLLSGSSLENLNSSNEIINSYDRVMSIIYDSKLLSLILDDYTLEGTVDSITCNWEIPFKVGKTVIKTTLTRIDGTAIKGIINIEGKDGKNILILEFEGSDYQKQKIILEKFEEYKK